MWDDFVFEEDLGMVLFMLKYILLLYPKIGTPESYVKRGKIESMYYFVENRGYRG